MTKAERGYALYDWYRAQLRAGRSIYDVREQDEFKELLSCSGTFKVNVNVYSTALPRDPEVYVQFMHHISSDIGFYTLWADSLHELVKFVIKHHLGLLSTDKSYYPIEIKSIINFFVLDYQTIINHEESAKLIKLLESMQEENLELVKQLLQL